MNKEHTLEALDMQEMEEIHGGMLPDHDGISQETRFFRHNRRILWEENSKVYECYGPPKAIGRGVTFSNCSLADSWLVKHFKKKIIRKSPTQRRKPGNRNR